MRKFLRGSLGEKKTPIKKTEKNYYYRIPYDDDDELYDLLQSFNAFLSKLIKQYGLNQSEVNKLIEMFRDGKSFNDIEAYAMQLGQEHQRQSDEACQKIADTMAGGRGSFRGHLGKNNSERNKNDGWEMSR